MIQTVTQLWMMPMKLVSLCQKRLMGCGHHREDMPLANRRQRLEDAELKLPREHLLVEVILSQKTQPHINAIKHNNSNSRKCN
jgi:hypothetical protein